MVDGEQLAQRNSREVNFNNFPVVQSGHVCYHILYLLPSIGLTILLVSHDSCTARGWSGRFEIESV